MQGEHGNVAIPNKKEKSLKMKRCRDGVPKSTQTGGSKSEGKYIQSFIHPYIFSQYSKDVAMVVCTFILIFRSFPVCVLFGMPSLIFLSCIE